MKLISSKQVDLNSININSIDLLICALGYESRCTELARKYADFLNPRYVFAFDNHLSNEQRLINDGFYASNEFDIIQINGNDDTKIVSSLNRFTQYSLKEDISILIDYSSMTSVMYASFLKYFVDCSRFKSVKVYFSYTHAKFSPSQSTTLANRSLGPMKGFISMSIPNKPTALIIGLGYERGKAFGLSEYLDAETYIFYTEEEKDNLGFTKEVERQNEDLLKYFNKDNIVKYPIFNLELTQNLLYQVCSDLNDDYRIILAPCGPKPFTLLCLVTALKLSNIDVWRISSDSEELVYDRKANGRFSVIECTLHRAG